MNSGPLSDEESAMLALVVHALVDPQSIRPLTAKEDDELHAFIGNCIDRVHDEPAQARAEALVAAHAEAVHSELSDTPLITMTRNLFLG
jgi:hypothetical protein